MPKVTWKTSEVNQLAELFSIYKKRNKLTNIAIAEKLNRSEIMVKKALNRRPEEWRIGDLLKYCKAIGIPAEAALAAAIGKDELKNDRESRESSQLCAIEQRLIDIQQALMPAD